MKAAELTVDWFTREKGAVFFSVPEKRRSRVSQELLFGYVKDGEGEWVTVLNCPQRERHTMADTRKGISGPTFAECAACPYQTGTGFQELNADGSYDGAAIFPDKLRCGHPAGH